jgi:hypothetical protein
MLSPMYLLALYEGMMTDTNSCCIIDVSCLNFLKVAQRYEKMMKNPSFC